MPETRLTTETNVSDSPVRCQLVVVEGPDMGRAVNLDGVCVVGTNPECTLRLSDERISGAHFQLSPSANQRYSLKDLGSSNGTFYEGGRVTEVEVPVGATFKVGHSFLRIQPQPRPLEVRPSQARRFGDLVAESLAMREVFAVLELAAQSDVTVLVSGETGTGKELVARALHEASGRRKGPFVAVDCGALPESLLESELFGHIKGAFTGAAQERRGAFQRANRGSLFLDELGAITPAVQARLLRVLEERKVKPVGSDDERAIDVRVIASSPMNLANRVAEGAFRPDLYYRLSVLSLELPPLRSRREDLPLIVKELLAHRGIDAGDIKGPNFDRLIAHRWPGNVRELRNVIDRAVALTPMARNFASLRLDVNGPLAASDSLSVRTDLPFKEAKDAVLDAFERAYLNDLQMRHGGNLSAAARDAEVDRKHWRSLLLKHGLTPPPGDDE